jgi:hypothetical protein
MHRLRTRKINDSKQNRTDGHKLDTEMKISVGTCFFHMMFTLLEEMVAVQVDLLGILRTASQVRRKCKEVSHS